jgi:hypothetical protein
MNLQDRSLYHQIHPLKLLTDWGTGIFAPYLFWGHNLATALVIALIPSAIVSFVLIRFANLEKYKESSFGKYVHKYIKRQIEATRLAGYAVMAIGAWAHIIWLIPLGLLIILLGWIRGLIFTKKSG